jgi:hypothetical protein
VLQHAPLPCIGAGGIAVTCADKLSAADAEYARLLRLLVAAATRGSEGPGPIRDLHAAGDD